MLTLPRDDLKKQEILTKIVVKFEKEKKYNETEVNEVIKSFDVDDHVLIRRELINFGYMQRDPYKGIYWVITYELTREQLQKIEERSKKIKKIEEEI